MKFRQIFLIAFFFILTLVAYAQPVSVRIACLGNSITYGSGLSNPTEECYPAKLQDMLTEIYGDTCIVENFAVSGRTMLKHGDYPLWNESQMEDAVNFAPNICLILLGTNDSKPQNWDSYEDEFIGDYISMIDTFLNRNPATDFIVCYPPPAFEIVWGIRDSVIVHGVIPAIDSVLKMREAILVDFYNPLIDSVSLFPDYIHPGVEGSVVMADIVMDKILETQIVHNVDTSYTFIIGFESNNYLVQKKDTVFISWTSVSADSVTLNGDLVSSEGGKNIIIRESKYFELIAYGPVSNDTQSIYIEGYDVEIASLQITTSGNISTTSGAVQTLELIYFDQTNTLLDTLTSIDWSITQGKGILENQMDNRITLTIGASEKIVVEAKVGDITGYIVFRVENTDISKKEISVLIFPNPVKECFYVQLNDFFKSAGQIKLYSENGQLVYMDYFEADQELIYCNSKEFVDLHGAYIYVITTPEFCYSGTLLFK